MAKSSPILTLPQDVIIEIYLLLPLQSIASLRQCCSQLTQSISCDKQLWVRLIDRDKGRRRISLLPYRRTINFANAFAVESWIRNAITLEKAYESNLRLTLDHTVVQDRLSATWAKLIRGRWCLVATSNVQQSWLSLWDGGSTGRPLRMRYSLSGPVMDGLVEDTPDGIHLALSIGTRSPHIQVLRLAQWQDHIRIDKLATIDGASHTRVLRGSLLGFAVRNGDDSFPQLIDWSSGKAYVLGLTRTAHSQPSPSSAAVHNTCWAMALWGDYVVVVLDSTITIYRRPNFSTDSIAELLEVIALGGSDTQIYIREAHCVICPDSTASDATSRGRNPSPNALGIIFRGNLRATYVTAIHELETSHHPRFLATRLVYWHSIPEAPDSTSAMRIFAGSTRSKILFYTSRPDEHDYRSDPPGLYFSDIRLTRCLNSDTRHADSNHPLYECAFGSSVQLSPSDLPLLHFYPYIDFDDARGILLITTSRGDFWTARVLREEILTKDSLDDGLPSVRPVGLTEEHAESLTMDLPMYYKYRSEVENDHIPDNLRSETIERWQTPGCDNLELPGWSKEWDAFPDFNRWVIPPLCWGIADNGFQNYSERSIVTLIRHHCCILGDPIPLLYDDYNSVIFHVGQRLYIIKEGQEDWYSIVQVLLTLSEFSSDPSRLSASRDVNVEQSYRDWNLEALDNIVQAYDESLEHVAMGDIDIEFDKLDPDPAKWTKEQWDEITEECLYYNDCRNDLVT